MRSELISQLLQRVLHLLFGQITHIHSLHVLNSTNKCLTIARVVVSSSGPCLKCDWNSLSSDCVQLWNDCIVTVKCCKSDWAVTGDNGARR